jgi:LmbE family N-acetylglucosaminyl deacetylase
MNVLVIAPHPDDEAIGCGGTLCKHSARRDRVAVVFLTSGELGLKKLPREQAWKTREAEAGKSAKVMGIASLDFLRLPDWYVGERVAEGAKLLLPILEREQPALIYLPHALEWHPDHKAAWPILRAALRGLSFPVPQLRGYEVWTPLADVHHLEDISQTWPRKVRAIRAHRSQLAEIDYARAAKGLNQYRGEITGKMQYAEAFQAIELDRRK